MMNHKAASSALVARSDDDDDDDGSFHLLDLDDDYDEVLLSGEEEEEEEVNKQDVLKNIQYCLESQPLLQRKDVHAVVQKFHNSMVPHTLYH